jgi:hypothetical protein
VKIQVVYNFHQILTNTFFKYTFIIILEQGLDVHFSRLIDRLIFQAESKPSLKLLRLVVSSFSSIISSKPNITPFFDSLILIIEPYLVYNEDKKNIEYSIDFKFLHIECIDLLGICAIHLSKEKFDDKIIKKCLDIIQDAIDNKRDVEIKTAAYNLLGGLATKLEDNLPINEVMPHIIKTLKCEEELSLSMKSKDKKRNIFDVLDEIDLQEHDLLDDDGDEKHFETEEEYYTKEYDEESTIKNECIAEILSALYSINEISNHLNKQLFDHYSECIEETYKLIFFDHDTIRREAFLTLVSLITYYHDFCIINLEQAYGDEKEMALTSKKK